MNRLTGFFWLWLVFVGPAFAKEFDPYVILAEQDRASLLNAVGMEMVFVNGGCYEMGDFSGQGGDDERPAHPVCVKDFHIGKYEVTQRMWRMMMGSNPSKFLQCGEDCPVEGASWEDVQEFLGRLNAITDKRYRLPTEAEWEFAARSGGKREIYAGGDDERPVAWHRNNSGGMTHPAGRLQANGLGLHDMSGNVAEWCSDWYAPDFYANSPKENPRGPEAGTHRVTRGGGWYYRPWFIRSSARDGRSPDVRSNGLGFRLARPD